MLAHRRAILAAVVGLSAFWFVSNTAAADRRAKPSNAADAESLRRMVDEYVVTAGVKNQRVLEAMRSTPRERFVPAPHRGKAYFDMALPIGDGQSISPPGVVARMTEALDPQPDDRVLEIGTGSGYQAAVLSGLVKDVYTIEIVEPLARHAAKVLETLGYKNVHAKAGDGYQGWAEHAPFNKIIVTCSPEDVPRPLVEQLAEGGRIVVPLGGPYEQMIYILRKEKGELRREALEPTMFVPMTGQAASDRTLSADGSSPALVGGDFEKLGEDGRSPLGWYYFRQGALERRDDAPQGASVITFRNETPSRTAQALQAFALDGRKVHTLDIHLWLRAAVTKQQLGGAGENAPKLIVSFFAEDRAPVSVSTTPLPAHTQGWKEINETIRVPERTRSAGLWIGLLGATGECSFDDVRMTKGAK